MTGSIKFVSIHKKLIIGWTVTLLSLLLYARFTFSLRGTVEEADARMPMGGGAFTLTVLLATAILVFVSAFVFLVVYCNGLWRGFYAIQLVAFMIWIGLQSNVLYDFGRSTAGLKIFYRDSIHFRNVSSSTIGIHRIGEVDPGDSTEMTGDFGAPPLSPNTIKFSWWYGKSFIRSNDPPKIYSKSLIAPRTRETREIQVDIGDNGEAIITVLRGKAPPSTPPKNNDFWKQRQQEDDRIVKKRQELLDEWKHDNIQ